MPQERPRPQHLEALDQANRIRRRRYAIRRRVLKRELSLTALFTPGGLPPTDAELLESRHVRELLEWGYRVGDTTSRRILSYAEVKPTMALSALSDARRSKLVEAILSAAPEACTGVSTLAELEPDTAGQAGEDTTEPLAA